MPRMLRVKEGDDGWSNWMMPVMDKYHMGCCDCGLVHTLQFRVMRVSKKSGQFSEGPDVSKNHRVLFRAKRNRRSTAAMRRKKR
jgi:hypothetical protein